MQDDTTPGNAEGEEELLAGDDEVEEKDEEAKEGPDDESDAEEDGDEADEESESEADPDKPELSKSARRREKQRAREDTLREIARHESERADKAAAALKTLAADLGPEPKRDDFTDLEEYTAAKAAWLSESRMIAREKKLREQNVTDTRTSAADAKRNLFQERVLALKDRYPDIEAKVFDPSAPISQAMAEAVQDSDKAGELAYYLATHREEALRIAKMSPLAAAREVGRIEAKLETPKPRTQTKAPPPVRTVGGATTKVAKDPDKMNEKDWLAWRNAQLEQPPPRKKAS